VDNNTAVLLFQTVIQRDGIKPDGDWLRRFALLTAACTLLLICAGGVVTSKGVGMAVPDWPTTYGYNMFFFPFSKWVGGIFYEHSHRLIGSVVGLLTTILALWLNGRRSRPILRWGGALILAGAVLTGIRYPARTPDTVFLGVTGLLALGAGFRWPSRDPAPRWLRGLGWIAFVGVVIQGVLGGLRVTAMKDEIGIFHATFAQLFFALMCAIALFTTRGWHELGAGAGDGRYERWRTGFALVTGMVLLQLVLGATMRHQHAGIAVPDFPLAYGGIWPATDPESIRRYNQGRMEALASNPITAAGVWVHMLHRLIAAGILAAVGGIAWRSRKSLGAKNPLTRLSGAWFVLVLMQFSLGALTVLTNKAADIATGHVAVGALTLATGALLVLVAHRLSGRGRLPAPVPSRAVAENPALLASADRAHP
jgi:cytochrome c oxidase assembly protein subunit 15